MPMKTVAFATYDREPELTASDRLAVAALARLGVAVRPAIWRSPDVDWHSVDAVVVRSCWEYHLLPDEFVAWIDRLERERVPLWNPAPLLRWNLDKGYLRGLEARGVPTVPTEWLARGSEVELPRLLAGRGWERAVVKPTVSASAYETFVTSPETAARDEEAARRILATSGLMVQRFLGEIATGGEWSVVFFGREYSHTVLKRPKAGDFRVQSDFGGSAEACEPPEAILSAARRVVEAVDGPLLYARVDGVEVDGEMLLMELEVIDPELFFAKSPPSADRFARTLLALS